MLVEMKVAGLTLDPITEMPILILRDLEGKRPLPIWIGVMEAGSIAKELEQIHLSRPTAHDLLKTVLDELRAKLLHVEISALRDDTFYAALALDHEGRYLEVDARPSDAVALALRAECKILVAEAVLQQASSIDLRPGHGTAEGDPAEGPHFAKDLLASLPDEEFGKWKM